MVFRPAGGPRLVASSASARALPRQRATPIERLLARYDVDNEEAIAHVERRLQADGRDPGARGGRLPARRRRRDRGRSSSSSIPVVSAPALARAIAARRAARRQAAPLRRAPLGALRAASPARRRAVPGRGLLHGGSWRAGYGKVLMRPLCRDLVRRGWAAWNVEYRRLGGRQGGGWPATFDDVAAAIDALARRRRAPGPRARRVPGATARAATWRCGRRARRRARRRCARARGRPGAGRRPRARRRPARARAARRDAGASSRSATRRPTRRARCRSQMPALLVHGAEDATVTVEQSRATRRRRGRGRRASSSSSRRAATATTSTRARPRGPRSPRGSTRSRPERGLSCASRGPLRRQAGLEHRRARRRRRCATTCSSTSARRSPSATRRATTS